MQWGGQGNHNNRVAAAQNADPLNDHMQGALRPKTHLIQLYINNIEDAVRNISETHNDGVPLMAIPVGTATAPDCCCCTCKMNIPNGMYVLHQSWGEDQGLIDPGC